MLSNTYKGSGITFLYTNENFFYDPSMLSYYEDETELDNDFYNETNKQKGEVVQETVSVVYFPREQHAELVNLMKKKNILRRVLEYVWNNLGCAKKED